MSVALQTALDYLGIDYADKMVEANVTRAIASAEKILLGAVGEDVRKYLPDDSRIDELVLLYMDDLYNERGMSGLKASYAKRRLVDTMEHQLRLELRRKKEEVAGGDNA